MSVSESPSHIDRILDIVSIIGSIETVITFAILVYGIIASVLFWRSKAQMHKYTRVYFPKDRQDFYRYYVDQVSKAKQAIYITSDGFNMRNTLSREAAQLMNAAQAKAIRRGATVFRYQMTETMHLNWLGVICDMKKLFGDKYRTYVNPKYEAIGNFAVIDPGMRRAVTEFMLPDIGGIAQATIPRDYGFVHGHQGKANQAKAVFDRILSDPDTVEITDENLEDFRRKLFNKRMELHLNVESPFHLFDEEVLRAMKVHGRDVSFEDLTFDHEQLEHIT